MNAMSTPQPDELAWTLPVYAQLALEPVGGKGAWLELADGRRILDMYGGHAVAALGYGHPRLVAALQDQVRRLTFQSNLLPLALRARACEALARFAPPGPMHSGREGWERTGATTAGSVIIARAKPPVKHMPMGRVHGSCSNSVRL